MADGKGCRCAAHSAAECGCDADWTPQEVYDLRTENAAMREMLQRQNEASIEAVKLLTEASSRYGFMLGGLEMVAAGHTTAEAVLARTKEKYGE